MEIKSAESGVSRLYTDEKQTDTQTRTAAGAIVFKSAANGATRASSGNVGGDNVERAAAAAAVVGGAAAEMRVHDESSERSAPVEMSASAMCTAWSRERGEE